MLNSTARPWSLTGIALLTICVAFTSKLRAQEGGADAPAQPIIPCELDTEAILNEKGIFSPSASDGVWTLTPTAGLVLFQVPLKLDKPETEFELGFNTIRVTGGRLLAYRIAYDIEQSLEIDKKAYDLPETTPRFTRRIVIQPDGLIAWKLDRFIPNATLTGTTGYAMRIDPSLLNNANPGSLPEIKQNADEDYRAFLIRRQIEVEDYRKKVEAFRDLRKAVLELPTDISMSIPPRIWAVFEIRGNPDKVTLEGTRGQPWSIDYAAFEAMRKLVSVDALTTDGGISPQVYSDILPIVTELQARPHFNTYRMAALTLTQRDIVRMATVDDPIYRLAQLVLKGNDTHGRLLLIRELAATIPPTAASTTLLKTVAESLDPQTQLLTLTGLLKTDLTQPVAIRELVTGLNRLLGDSKGPPPENILENIEQNGPMHPGLVAVVSQQTDMAAMPDARRAEFVRTTVAHAVDSPLAAAWLDRTLLGSTDLQVVRMTLETLRDAEVGPAGAGVVGKAIGAIFKSPKDQANEQAVPRVRLARPIPIPDASHSIYRVLQSADKDIRALAWTVLNRFRFDPPAEPATSPDAPDERYAQLTLAALGQRPVPPEAVEFLLHQPRSDLVGEQLMQFILRTTGQASRQASEAIIGLNAPLGELLLKRSYNEREEFASRLYFALTQNVPRVTAILRHRVDNHPVATWLGKQISEGTLPDPSRWINAYSQVEDLFALIPSNDESLAQGAVAVLVNSAGGDDSIVDKLTRDLRALPSPTVPALMQEWTNISRQVLLDRIRNSALQYSVSLLVHPPMADTNAPPQSPEKIAVGSTRITYLSDAVSFGNLKITVKVSDSVLGLEIATPAEVGQFGSADLSRLSLDTVPGPWIIRPFYDKSWQGSIRTPDGRTLDLILKPQN
ncbi:MAG: hypothetical protein GC164_13595 [Phycisphaera sp.]|nr:hypothetical protein [Phycisphaera sp.]